MNKQCATSSASFIHSLRTGDVRGPHQVRAALLALNALIYKVKIKLSTAKWALNNNSNIVISNIY